MTELQKVHATDGSIGTPRAPGLNTHSVEPYGLQGHSGNFTIAVIDDEPDVLGSLKAIVQASGEFYCVGAYASGREALEQVPRCRPDIVLSDVRMPGISGAELVRKLKVALPSLAVVLVSGFVGEGLWCDIADSGADAFLVKPLVLTQCLATLRFVVMEKPSKQQSAEANESPARLNNREAAVMKSLAAGMFYKEIADCFHWSLAQVKKFQHSAYVKLGAHTRSDAVRRFEGTDG